MNKFLISLVLFLIFCQNSQAIFNGERIDNYGLDPAQFEPILYLSGGGGHRGTGTHIGDGMILTALHVWDQVQERAIHFGNLEVGGARGETVASIPVDKIEPIYADEIIKLQLQVKVVSQPDVVVLVPKNKQVRAELAKLPAMTLYQPEISPGLNRGYFEEAERKSNEEIRKDISIIHRGENKIFLMAGYGYTDLYREKSDGKMLRVAQANSPYIDLDYLHKANRPIAIETSEIYHTLFPANPESRGSIYGASRPGDSGGPLLQVFEGKIYQIGVASSAGVHKSSESNVHTTVTTYSSNNIPEFIDLIKRARAKYSEQKDGLGNKNPMRCSRVFKHR